MSFVTIIQIIMQILAFIAGLFNPTHASIRQVAQITDYDCSAIRWVAPPVVEGGSFNGKAQIVCYFEGKGGGGIAALRNHLVAQLPRDSRMENGVEGSYKGLPSMAYSTALEMGEGAVARGTTHIASDGINVLRDVFQSSSVEASGNGRYLKGVFGELQVMRVDGDSGYELKMSQSFQVKKPMLVPASEFETKLKAQSEEALRERAASAVQEMASHL